MRAAQRYRWRVRDGSDSSGPEASLTMTAGLICEWVPLESVTELGGWTAVARGVMCWCLDS